MTKFVLWVILTAHGVTGGAHTQRVAEFHSFENCVAAAQAMYPDQQWECLPE
jgi:hypothetical protein